MPNGTDDGEERVPNVPVALVLNGSEIKHTVTDSNGEYKYAENEWTNYKTVNDGNTDKLIMLLSIQENPIELLITLLR